MNTISLRNVIPQVFANADIHPQSDVWLHDVDFERGRLYLIEANSGTGKSSLCSYIYGYRRDYEGTICFDSTDIKTLGVAGWTAVRQQTLSLLWQELRLFTELTAWENVVVKNQLTHHQSERQIDQWFEALGIADRKHTLIGRMSFGQQQRVALIRALCQPFSFIFVDEPISHLDDTNSAIVGQILTDEARRQGAAVVVTSIGKHMQLNYDKTLRL
ncbi:MAG: ATP-binding cassette domain-containing protein [Bacteroidaceae bacterium]|nr:ATP-binding cassette domain-containing protein [Bacteroidaceae bacterium]MBQ4277413.1 ATP-binding cassette domain-containing protein [Bacteroidaceae bacterium]